MTHSLKDWAALCGVSKPAVTQAVRKGILVKGDDGRIDDTHPTNRLYLDGKTGVVKKPVPSGVALGTPTKKRTPKKPDAEDMAFQKAAIARLEKKAKAAAKKDGEPAPEEDEEPDVGEMEKVLESRGKQAELLIRKLQADIAYKEAATARYDLEIEIKKGNLMERAQFVAFSQGIQKALDDHMNRVAPKLGPVVFATATKGEGTELEVIRIIEQFVGRAAKAAVEDIARAG